jgi:hypothetical protein
MLGLILVGTPCCCPLACPAVYFRLKVFLAGRWLVVSGLAVGAMDEAWNRRRGVAIAIICLVLAAVTIVVILLAGAALSSSSHDYSDRLVAAGDIFAAGTLALAVIAGIVAVMAYVAATGRPALKIQVDFGTEYVNSLVFTLKGRDDTYSPRPWQISLRNNSSYSARLPAVVVRLGGISSVRNTLTQHWQLLDTDTHGVTAIQWDAEPTESVHGQSIRRLPQIDFGELVFHDLSPSDTYHFTTVTFELLAEGYRRVVTLPTMVVLPDHPGHREFRQPLWL